MEQRETFFSLWSRRIMEAGWLLALIMIPVYFSLLSDRHFEPDKATVLRSIALIVGAAWIINIIERRQVFRHKIQWRTWIQAPLIIPTLVYLAVFILTTITSVLVLTSFWGGYNRLQGLFTNMAYIVLFGAIVSQIRTRRQVERLITVIVATALPVLGYGWVQNQAIDPLPWAGDTAARVASTMGNSIFVAAYLILVLPFMLYRLVGSILQMRQSTTVLYADRNEEVSEKAVSETNSAAVDLGWMAAFGLLGIGQISFLWGILKLGALLQAPLIGFDHWWIFPGAVIVVGSTFTLYSYRHTATSRNDWRLYAPGALLLLFLFMLMAGGYLTAKACSGNVNQTCLNLNLSTASRATNYNSWLLAGIGSFLVAFGLFAGLPRRANAEPSRIMSSIAIATFSLLSLFTILIIFYTQSRGPQIGMFVSLFTFITLFLIQGWRTYHSKLYLGFLSGWILISMLAAAFLVVLNTSDSFPGLRENPYIARLGNLLETEGGTGRVRVLIWRGDDITDGAVGLVTSNPVRTMIGWGPEAMFVAYNPFYPPELATLESRGASPDRSHQAMLDELVTKGALGLFSYLFLYGSFAILMMRLLQIRRSINILITTFFMVAIAAFFTIFLQSITLGIIALVSGVIAVGLAVWLGYAKPLQRPVHFGWQILIVASIASVVANFVENIFGIPIVSSLLYTWTTMGIGVIAGALAGAYHLGYQVEQPTEAVEETAEVAAVGGTRKARAKAAQRTSRARGRTRAANAPWRSAYPILLIVGIVGSWVFNLDGIYADMRFLQAKQWIDQGGSFDRHLLGYAALQDAIDAAPHEDLYFLTYGRALMTLATDVSQLQNKTLQENPDPKLAAVSNQRPDPNAQLSDLPEINYSSVDLESSMRSLATTYGPLQLLDYARLALEHAKELNPQNKDHPANLGRLQASWYRNVQTINPEEAQQHLDEALKNYELAVKIAPQDVELAGQWAMLHLYNNNDEAGALAVLDNAMKLDSTYGVNLMRKAEILRRQGKLQEAAEAYGKAFADNPRVLGSLIDVAELPAEREQRLRDTYATFSSEPALAQAFVAGFPAALAERPSDLGYRQTYVDVLSSTLQYKEALDVARESRSLAQELNNSKMVDTFDAAIKFLESNINS